DDDVGVRPLAVLGDDGGDFFRLLHDNCPPFRRGPPWGRLPACLVALAGRLEACPTADRGETIPSLPLQLREARRRRDLLAALRQPYEAGARPLDRLDQLEAALRAEHGDDLRQTVRRRAVARHDGRAHAAEEANARFRIDNVRIALAVDL